MTTGAEIDSEFDETAREAVRVLAEVLYVDSDSIDLDVPLPDLGLDSILAIEYAAQLRERLGFEATIDDLFALNTPRGVARHIQSKQVDS